MDYRIIQQRFVSVYWLPQGFSWISDSKVVSTSLTNRAIIRGILFLIKTISIQPHPYRYPHCRGGPYRRTLGCLVSPRAITTIELPRPSNLPSFNLTSMIMTTDDPSVEVVLRLECKETLLPLLGDGRRRNGRWLGFIDHDLDPRSHWPTHPLSTE